MIETTTRQRALSRQVDWFRKWTFQKKLIIPVILSAVSLACVGSAVAQDGNDKSDPKASSESVNAKLSDTALGIKLKEAAALGRGHRKFKTVKKQYTQQIKYWRSADATALESKGRSDSGRILGQRFLTQSINARWMEKSFEGFAVLGYDNPTDEFVLTWKSTLHTDIFIARGKNVGKGKEITLLGDYRDPISGETQKIKIIFKLINKKGETLITAFDVTNPDNEYKFLEVKSKRFIRAAA